MEKNNKKIINAWCMYDWANSVYSLTITTAVFPVYFLAMTENVLTNNKVNFLGWNVTNSVLYSYALSFAFLLSACLSPILTSIADYSGRKKSFMRFFCYLGSISCIYLYFFTKDNVTLSLIAFVLAGIGYSGSIVFYNSFLPEIATDEMADKVSAKGFAFGYVGSVILLVFNLAMIQKPEWFGMAQNTTMPARISFLSVGIWWFIFAQYSFYYLPSNVFKKSSSGNLIIKGFQELKTVLTEIKVQTFLKKFLISFFFYNMGVQTVMYMATIFGKQELNLPTATLIQVILIIQIIAIVGANLFAKVSGKYGNIKAIIAVIVIWIIVCVTAYFVKSESQFYILAVIVGFVMGGIQSLSRSTYSKLIPQDTENHASYFSFYDVMDKVSTFVGTLMFGVIAELSGGMRNSTLALSAFFIIGMILLWNIPSKKVYNLVRPLNQNGE